MTNKRADVVFAERDSGPLLMDVVLPDRPTGSDPAIVWLHGGGWYTGDRTLAPDLHRYFASRGFVMAGIEYRLSGEAVFPAQLFDVRSAVRHLRTHAAEYGIDASAIGLWGSSAGGHLAALAGVSGHIDRLPGEPVEAGDCAVQAVVDGYGPVDFTIAARQALPGSAVAPEDRLLGGPAGELTELADRANPAKQAGPGAPPFLIAHGDADVLVPSANSVLLHETLEAHGNDSTLYLIDGYAHGFFNPGGRDDVPAGVPFDAGRLEREGHAPSTIRRSGPSAGPETDRGTFSFDTVEEFFTRHLATGASQTSPVSGSSIV